MNRRFFLQSLGLASVGGIVACSFPKVIIPKNIVQPVTLGEVFFHSDKLNFKISDDPYYGFGYYVSPPEFEVMTEAYKRACEGSAEPSCIYIKEGFIYNV